MRFLILLMAGVLLAQDSIDSIVVHFAKTPAQQQQLDDLLEDLYQPGSASYHRWLEPKEFKARFGPTEAAQARVRQWLSENGLKLDYAGGTHWVISGNVGQVERAIGARLAKEPQGSRRRFARLENPKLPPEILHLGGLDDPRPKPQAIGRTANAPDGSHLLAPGDYRTIYNVPAEMEAPGQRIAIVGQSAINLEDMRAFRRRYNLPALDPEVILVPGSADPGFNDDQLEANLDLQWAGALASRSRLFYVYGSSALLAAAHVIDENLAPILSVSFTAGCEAELPQSTLAAFRNLAQRAAAQGITWINSSGDAGPAGCDGNRSFIAQNGFGVETPNSVPEITSIGGTELNDREGVYWAASNDASGASALGYIPETTWNQSRRGTSIAAGGSGVSIFYPRPLWQSGPGLGDDRFRMVPDLSLAASTYNGYSVIHRGRPTIVGGTSAGTPAFASMLALILEATNRPNGYGNLNRILYPLAEAQPDAFRDITVGDTRVPCVPGSRDCGEGSFGFAAGPRYDLATGLGSVNFARLLDAWPRGNATQSLVTISSSRNPIYATATETGPSWVTTLTMKEHAGVETTLTSFRVDDIEQIREIEGALGTLSLRANGIQSLSVTFRNLTTPLARTIAIAGRDASGQSWARTLFLSYLGTASAPRITGLANGASFAQSFAPGGILSVFGTNLAQGTQVAGALPLTRFSQGIRASINGQTARFYYVSPNQVNLQIPYEVQPGPATLTMSFPQQGSSSVSFTVSPVAPGIFTNADLFTVPQTSCRRGETCILFLTGQGGLSPAIQTGEAPALTSLIEDLPRPVQPVGMTIGDTPAQIAFAGIPPGLVGVMQINFTVAPNTPVGSQRVVVKVGETESAGARINIQ